jgi:hypothetical protein
MTRAPEARQAGAEEIEITLEMMRQGVFACSTGTWSGRHPLGLWSGFIEPCAKWNWINLLDYVIPRGLLAKEECSNIL